MSRYTDEKNPYANRVESGWSRMRECEIWKEGYLAAEKEVSLTDPDALRFFCEMVEEAEAWNLSEPDHDALQIIKKKVLGE